MRRFLPLACAFFVLGTSASQATMKPYYADNAKCRAILKVTYEALAPDIAPGETEEQALERNAKDNPLSGGIVAAVYQAHRQSIDKFMADEAMATTGPEGHQIQLIEDAETARLRAIVKNAKTEKQQDDAFETLLDAADPCMEWAGK